MIFAPRRYGKSSLIWRVAQGLVKEKVLVTQVDLMTTPAKERLAEKLAKAIHEEIASALFRAKDRLNVFRGLRIAHRDGRSRRRLGLVQLRGRPGERRREDATLERLLGSPAASGAERKRRVVLVLDEFQEVVEIDAEACRG